MPDRAALKTRVTELEAENDELRARVAVLEVACEAAATSALHGLGRFAVLPVDLRESA
jgi:hypothetical protein